MTRRHSSYDEIDTPTAMREDAAAASRALARAAAAPAPSLEYADYPREVRKREIRVDEAAARLAAALHLHLD